MDGSGPSSHRFTADEFLKMGAAGIFGDQARLELIKGTIVDMAPIGTPHLLAVNRLTNLLTPLLAGRAVVSVQNALRLDDGSEPQPDVAVLAHPAGLLERPHPGIALLVIEVSDSTLDFDRTTKSAMYAAAGIPEYWIVDLVHGVVEVRRKPNGTAYEDASVSGERLTIPSIPDASIERRMILPGQRAPAPPDEPTPA